MRATLIFFEGGSRLAASLADMAAVFGPRDAAVARELTKLHETVVRAPLDVLAADPRFETPKGEIVVLVGPGEETAATPEQADAALTAALTRVGPGEAAAEVAKALGLPRRDLYARALALRAVRGERGARSRREGRRGEVFCALWLFAKGYRLLGFRLRTPLGEIDLLVQKHSVIALVEIKRRRTIEDALLAVTPIQRDRLLRAARSVVARRPALADMAIRLDLIALAPGRLPRHIRDAWRED